VGRLITDLLEQAGILEDAVVVIFHAEDGYTTSIPLTEVMDRQMLLAHRANGEVLTPRWGFPFIVVAQDKLGYKWARWVTGIELSSDLDYKGFWEQRGYDNEADID
jgi:DMSO/TMAO reductase YedYZ molybdopterin-dependent catalytic subunit